MVDEVIIHSSRGDYELQLFNPHLLGSQRPVDYFSVTLKGYDITVSLPIVSTLQSFDLTYDLPWFFEDIAANWKGWKGEKIWASIEDDFVVKATSDSTGHICLEITMKSDCNWRFQGEIWIDAGDTEDIAKKSTSFYYVSP